ncbi:helix-turn-helix transcriptional regulator [Propionivibrio sp.]|uniref:helix-turn-helix domain-containing protein n=1 Tax=Propionivibrio sp. TaxID=2212460 RepID=UPI0025F92C3E|nr:helix-turn-helix transcriptional regulator [Propionivibrio sp.]
MRNELAKTIGRTIAQWRTAAEMTQEELAAALDIDPMTVSRFERGVTLPSLATLQHISDTFGVSMAQMLEDVPTPSTEDASAIARLMKRLTLEEQKFLIDTLRRYQAMQRKQQKQGALS